jgi:acyl-CoA dehydrogenase
LRERCARRGDVQDAAARSAQRAVVVAPRWAGRVIDRAIQMLGAGGVSLAWFRAQAWAGARSLRLADGPDEVHITSLARSMLKA